MALSASLSGQAQSTEDDPLPPLPPLNPLQEPPRDWAAWLGVGKLLGISQADITSSGSYYSDTTRKREFDQHHTRVFMELTVPGPDELITSRSAVWRVTAANGVGTMLSTYSSYSLAGGEWLGGEGTTLGSYTGPLSLRVRPTLSFRLADGVGQFSTLGEPPVPWAANFNASVTELNPVGGGVRVRNISEVQMQAHPLEHSAVDFTAPKAAVPFSGRFEVKGPTGLGQGSFHRTASVQFWPDWDDLEVRVEIEDSTKLGASYSDWRPEGNLQSPDEGGPRPLRLKATLRPKAEFPTAEQLQAMPPVRRFRFELADTSREPGVCMNWPSPAGTNAPAPPPDPEYDLRFIATIPQAMELSPRKQKAGVRPLPGEDPRLPSAWVLLECFDFGAHANLQVYADLADGRVIVGHLKVGEEKRYLIPIPDRQLGSFVAQKWREDQKVTGPDSDDVDDQPVGDGQKGDGFSVYEEYRGFRVKGAHVSPDPSVKDLFVRSINEGPVSAACRTIEANTVEGGGKGLKVYEELTADEWHASRVMNPNRGPNTPRSSDEPQHGVLVQPNPVTDGEAGYSYADRFAWPRRPKNIRSVLVLPSDNTVETIAHELTHSIGCGHHGDVDYYARWIVRDVPAADGTQHRRYFEQKLKADATTGALTPDGNAFQIRVFREGQGLETVPDQSTNRPPPPRLIYVAQRGGQNSGEETCYMRYANAGAYIPSGRSLDRIQAAQTTVLGDDNSGAYFTLCRSCKGTGVNPRRYGNANVGKCLAQICVRDSAPDRPVTPGQCGDSPSQNGGAAILSLATLRAPSAAAPIPAGAAGVLVIDLEGKGDGAQATRGWPLHLFWHALDRGPVESTLVLSGAGGAMLSLRAVSPGHWWISPEQTRVFPLGAATARVGPVTVPLRLVDAPASPLPPTQDSVRRRSLIRYYLAVGLAADARREAEDWVAASPNAPTPRALLGDALAALGLLPDALDAFEECFSRMRWFESPPEDLFRRYNKLHGAWLAQLPLAASEPTEEPEPASLEEKDRVYGLDTKGQWAATATASSEYRTTGDYSAARATGVPDVIRYGDSPRAWASRLADSGPEWLELTFPSPAVATAVRVRQVFNPGAITRIEVFDGAGAGSTVFSGVDTNTYASTQIGWFVAKFPRTAQPVQRVRITLDSARVKGWNEIDAVQLVAAPELPPQAPTLTYTYRVATGTLEIAAGPPGFVLQRATQLSPADWQNYPNQPPVSVPITGSPAFFRLVQTP